MKFGGLMNDICNLPEANFDYIWFWKKKLPERKGQRCRVLIRSKRLNSVLVEFEDGFRTNTSRFAIRKVN